MNSNPSKEGWLQYYKYEGGKKTWARKYFRLHDEEDYLTYADNETVKPKRRINLDECLAEDVPKKASKFHFKVSNEKGVQHHFRASNEQEMLDWMDAISPPIWSDDDSDKHQSERGSKRQARPPSQQMEPIKDGDSSGSGSGSGSGSEDDTGSYDEYDEESSDE